VVRIHSPRPTFSITSSYSDAPRFPTVDDSVDGADFLPFFRILHPENHTVQSVANRGGPTPSCSVTRLGDFGRASFQQTTALGTPCGVRVVGLLTRDTYSGDLDRPATLHKYAYAAGDPVNRLDRSGRADTMDYALLTGAFIATAAVIQATHPCIACIWLVGRGQANLGGVVAKLTTSALVVGETIRDCDVQGIFASSSCMNPAIASGDVCVVQDPLGSLSPQEPKKSKCATEQPGVPRCESLPFKCNFSQANSAASIATGKYVFPKNKRPGDGAWTNKCGKGTPWHFSTTTSDGFGYPGSIGCCECCEESNPKDKALRCAILNINHNPYTGQCSQ
jgi:hypothetical protein